VLAHYSFFCAEPFQRPNYFDGRLLTAQDLASEQNYHGSKQRQHNLHCHGTGVVSGLGVSTTNEKSGSTATVEPGLAIDPAGNEVHLCAPATFTLPKSADALQVGIRFSERFTGSVPNVMSGESETPPALVEEGCEIVLEIAAVTSDLSTKRCAHLNSRDVLPLARLIRKRGGWQLDRTFKVSRSH
jgi:hypothetical protein